MKTRRIRRERWEGHESFLLQLKRGTLPGHRCRRNGDVISKAVSRLTVIIMLPAVLLTGLVIGLGVALDMANASHSGGLYPGGCL